MSEAKDDLVERLRDTRPLHSVADGKANLESIAEYVRKSYAIRHEAASCICSLTEQVAMLTRERDDALATISLLQSQCRKQQEHDTAIIEGLTRDATEAELSRLRAENSASLSNTSEGGKGE